MAEEQSLLPARWAPSPPAVEVEKLPALDLEIPEDAPEVPRLV